MKMKRMLLGLTAVVSAFLSMYASLVSGHQEEDSSALPIVRPRLLHMVAGQPYQEVEAIIKRHRDEIM